MKTINIFAAKYGLKVVLITYKSNGMAVKRKGFDLVNELGYIIASFEPAFYTDFKWFVSCKLNSGLHYEPLSGSKHTKQIKQGIGFIEQHMVRYGSLVNQAITGFKVA